VKSIAGGTTPSCTKFLEDEEDTVLMKSAANIDVSGQSKLLEAIEALNLQLSRVNSWALERATSDKVAVNFKCNGLRGSSALSR